MKSIRLSVEGLDDTETRKKVMNQLTSLNGVQDINLSMDETFFNVAYDEQTSQAEIYSHLQNNGYKVK